MTMNKVEKINDRVRVNHVLNVHVEGFEVG